MQSIFNDTALFVNMSNLFNYVNLALGFAILLYLRHFLSYQQIASRSSIATFVPILTPEQSYLFVTGFTLWTVVLFLETLRGSDYLVLPGSIRSFTTFFLHLTRPILLTASVMYIGQGLMFFAALPVKEGKEPPNLDRINWMRHIGVLMLGGLWLSVLFAGPSGFDSVAQWIWLQGALIIWQWGIILHTAIMMRHSIHPIKHMLVLLMIVWAINTPAEMAWYSIQDFEGRLLPSLLTLSSPASAWKTAAVTTVALMLFLSMLLRANFLYVQETFRRAASFKQEKEVMISFLQRISERSVLHTQDAQSPNEVSDIQGHDLERLLKLTLQFGKEVGAAKSGAIFVRDDLKDMLLERTTGVDKGKFLTAHAVFGLYPPHLDIGKLPESPDQQQSLIHEMVKAEKVSLGKGFVGLVAKNGRSVLIEDALEDEETPVVAPSPFVIQTQLAIPLNVQNRTIAVLSLVNKENGDEFSFEDEATLNALAEQAAIAVMNLIVHGHLRETERLERQIELASEVQKCLLPHSCPNTPGYDLAATSIPAQEVGGDYFDFVKLDEEHLLIVVADVSDKGIPGALNMATVRSVLRSLSSSNMNARDLLIAVNQFIQPDLPRGNFISMLLGILHIPSGQMDVARAGHEPLMVLRNKEENFESYAPAGIALGLVNGDLFASNIESETVNLNHDDIAVLYTDGITESMNHNWEEFSLQRFEQTLKQSRECNSQEMIDAVKERISRFTGGTPQHDDLTLVILKRTAFSPDEMVLQSQPDAPEGSQPTS
ncbi:MAG: SpoIIE family protein phosphatase [Candidatus Hinthialibacter antarcticus]|nr:SpoIIE family protein phosphatase [Candidatus Hinthialibacter antarcticus]